MAIVLRTSSTTNGGTENSVSLGGYPSASAPSTTNGAFFDDTTSSQNDSGYTDYRCLFVYNSGSTNMSNVTVTASNKGGGATVTVALSSVATASYGTYNTAVIASKTTAPSVTGSYGSSVTIGTLNAGQVKAVWLKRVIVTNVTAASNDTVTVNVSADEVITP